MSTPVPATRTGREWLHDWNPNDEATGDKALAWRTLSITTLSLTLAFASWFIASALAPKLNNLGFALTTNQLYWLTAMPGLAGGTLRLVWMFLPPLLGTRRLVTFTTLLLLLPLFGWAAAVGNPDTPFWWFLTLSALAGIGGGAFSGFMPSTSYFFPKRLQGTALGIQAGVGNFGVSLVQFLTPWVVGFGMVGSAQLFVDKAAGVEKDVWYQNAALIYVPFVLIAAALAWTMLKSVPITANIRQQTDVFGNPDTWYMTLLYVMTFGTFSGLSAQFGLLLSNLYGSGNAEIVATAADGTKDLLVSGYSLPEVASIVFLGPLVGAGARVLFSPLTDRTGGAPWTLVSGIGIIASILYTLPSLEPDPAAGADALAAQMDQFVWGMLAIFLFSGIGNASTFKQMPMIFPARQAGGVIGWTAAIAAYGPFIFGVGLTVMAPRTFYLIGVAFAAMSLVITWVRYARPGAPKKS